MSSCRSTARPSRSPRISCPCSGPSASARPSRWSSCGAASGATCGWRSVSVLHALEAPPAHLAAVAERLREVTVEVGAGDGCGAGILWAPDLVVTNAHLARAASLQVRLADGRPLEARLVAADRRGPPPPAPPPAPPGAPAPPPPPPRRAGAAPRGAPR